MIYDDASVRVRLLIMLVLLLLREKANDLTAAAFLTATQGDVLAGPKKPIERRWQKKVVTDWHKCLPAARGLLSPREGAV